MTKSCYVNHQCPQCGGGVIFKEKATGTVCRFCGTGFIVLGGRSSWLHFLIKPRVGVKETLGSIARIARKKKWESLLVRAVLPFFLPFYRTTGQVIHWTKRERTGSLLFSGEISETVKARSIDLMRSAHKEVSAGLFSPGVRAQTLDLFLATRENVGQIPLLPIQVEKRDFLERTEKNLADGLDSEERGTLEEKTFLIWEHHSVLYFPLSLVEIKQGTASRFILLDAVGGGIVREIRSSEMETLMETLGPGRNGGAREGRLTLFPMICPECAGDLDPHPEAVVRFCARCGKAWETWGARLRRRKCYWSGLGKGPGRDKVVFLPFWRKSRIDNTVHIPAFGVQSPQLLFNISSRYFASDFPHEEIPFSRRLNVEVLPAVIPPKEADEMMEVVARTKRVDWISDQRTRWTLLLVPFGRRGPDFVDRIHGLAVPGANLEVQ